MSAAGTTPKTYKWQFVWRNIILYLIMHITGFYGIYLGAVSAQWKTVFYAWMLLVLALQGVTAGSHRYWSHKTYKAKTPLRVLLIFLQTLSLQNHAYDWASYHRVHHKYVDTDADPHNSRRGIFFSHMGWLFIRPEKEVEEKYNKIDLSDLHADKILMFQKKYYHVFFAPVIGVLIPLLIPCYFWGETLENSFFITTMARYCLCTNITFTVNSFAHLYGSRPYDNTIYPAEIPIVSVVTGGEGWHNFHHVFPWDYKAGEFGKYGTNLTTGFLDLMAAIGWAYDLKSASEEMIMKRISRTGDGTRKINKLVEPIKKVEEVEENENFWGWGDKDMKEEDFNDVKVHHRRNN